MKGGRSFFSLLKSQSILVHNSIEKFFHQVSPDEITLIKNTSLFSHLSPQQFDKVTHSIRLVKFPKGKLVFKEGDPPNELYIVKEGSVRVFTVDAQGVKIPLARLNKGDYFGEQAIIGQGSKTRNASIETIENTTLIRIETKIIAPLWEEEHKLKIKLKKIGYDQAIHSLTSSLQLYGDLKPILVQMENSVSELQDGEIIFNFGDKPDNAYFILHGEVKLLFPRSDTKELKQLILHKGYVFGELGVLENKPRLASAIAHKSVRLLVIEGDRFKQYYHQSPQLRELLSVLKEVYQLPMLGIVEQYMGKSPVLGDTITNIFKLHNGRTVVSIRCLTQKIFTMSVLESAPAVCYKYTKGEHNSAEIHVTNKHISTIKSYGEWEDFPIACKMLLNNEVIEDSILSEFSSTGSVTKKIISIEQKEIVCTCMSVTKNQIQKAIDEGNNSLSLITKETGACSVCMSCRYKILEMLGQSIWLTAVMKRMVKHNAHINSYLIKPTNNRFQSFNPGQYIIIQTKIGDNLIQRPYTISEKLGNGDLRITIEKEPKGLLTQWLFEKAPESIDVNVSQPQGVFTLNPDENINALCFAGGIGITPFITYAMWLEAMNNKKKMHILYSASKSEDFIFTDAFNRITKILPTVTISYKQTNTEGPLTGDEIIHSLGSLREPEIYICGHEGFEHLVSQTLRNISYDPKKIKVEKFLHAGSSTL
jgi:ferredoxin-NADP reductase/CRP-like cAMP-binding protein